MAADFRKLQSIIALQQQDLNDRAEEIASLKKQLDQAVVARDAATRLKDEATGSVASKVEAIAKEKAEAMKELQQLRAKSLSSSRSLNEELKSLRASLAEKEEALTAAKEQINALRVENKKTLNAIQARQLRLQEGLEAKMQEVVSLAGEKEDLSNRLAAATAALDSLRSRASHNERILTAELKLTRHHLATFRVARVLERAQARKLAHAMAKWRNQALEFALPTVIISEASALPPREIEAFHHAAAAATAAAQEEKGLSTGNNDNDGAQEDQEEEREEREASSAPVRSPELVALKAMAREIAETFSSINKNGNNNGGGNDRIATASNPSASSAAPTTDTDLEAGAALIARMAAQSPFLRIHTLAAAYRHARRQVLSLSAERDGLRRETSDMVARLTAALDRAAAAEREGAHARSRLLVLEGMSVEYARAASTVGQRLAELANEASEAAATAEAALEQLGADDESSSHDPALAGSSTSAVAPEAAFVPPSSAYSRLISGVVMGPEEAAAAIKSPDGRNTGQSIASFLSSSVSSIMASAAASSSSSRFHRELQEPGPDGTEAEDDNNSAALAMLATPAAQPHRNSEHALMAHADLVQRLLRASAALRRAKAREEKAYRAVSELQAELSVAASEKASLQQALEARKVAEETLQQALQHEGIRKAKAVEVLRSVRLARPEDVKAAAMAISEAASRRAAKLSAALKEKKAASTTVEKAAEKAAATAVAVIKDVPRASSSLLAAAFSTGSLSRMSAVPRDVSLSVSSSLASSVVNSDDEGNDDDGRRHSLAALAGEVDEATVQASKVGASFAKELLRDLGLEHLPASSSSSSSAAAAGATAESSSSAGPSTAALSRSISLLQQRLTASNGELSAASDRERKLRDERARLRKEVDASQAIAAALEVKLASAKDGLKSSLAAQSVLQAQLEAKASLVLALQERVAETAGTAADAEASKASIEAALSSATATAESLHARLQLAKEASAHDAKLIVSVATSSAALLATTRDRLRRLDEREMVIEMRVKQELADFSKEREALLDEAEQRISRAFNQLKDTEAALEEAKRQGFHAEEQASALAARVLQLEAVASQLQAEIKEREEFTASERQQLQETHDAAAARAAQEIDALQQELAATKENLSRTKQQLSKARDLIQSMEAVVSSQTTSLAEAQMGLQKKGAEAARLLDELTNATDRYHTVSSRVEALQEGLNEALAFKSEVEGELIGLRGIRAAAGDRLSALWASVGVRDGKVVRLTEQLHAVCSYAAELVAAWVSKAKGNQLPPAPAEVRALLTGLPSLALAMERERDAAKASAAAAEQEAKQWVAATEAEAAKVATMKLSSALASSQVAGAAAASASASASAPLPAPSLDVASAAVTLPAPVVASLSSLKKLTEVEDKLAATEASLMQQATLIANLRDSGDAWKEDARRVRKEAADSLRAASEAQARAAAVESLIEPLRRVSLAARRQISKLQSQLLGSQKRELALAALLAPALSACAMRIVREAEEQAMKSADGTGNSLFNAISSEARAATSFSGGSGSAPSSPADALVSFSTHSPSARALLASAGKHWQVVFTPLEAHEIVRLLGLVIGGMNVGGSEKPKASEAEESALPDELRALLLPAQLFPPDGNGGTNTKGSAIQRDDENAFVIEEAINAETYSSLQVTATSVLPLLKRVCKLAAATSGRLWIPKKRRQGQGTRFAGAQGDGENGGFLSPWASAALQQQDEGAGGAGGGRQRARRARSNSPVGKSRRETSPHSSSLQFGSPDDAGPAGGGRDLPWAGGRSRSSSSSSSASSSSPSSASASSNRAPRSPERLPDSRGLWADALARPEDGRPPVYLYDDEGDEEEIRLLSEEEAARARHQHYSAADLRGMVELALQAEAAQEEIRRRKDELALLESKGSGLEADLQSLGIQCAEANEKLADKSLEVRDLYSEVRELEQRLLEVDAEAKFLRQQVQTASIAAEKTKAEKAKGDAAATTAQRPVAQAQVPRAEEKRRVEAPPVPPDVSALYRRPESGDDEDAASSATASLSSSLLLLSGGGGVGLLAGSSNSPPPPPKLSSASTSSAVARPPQQPQMALAKAAHASHAWHASHAAAQDKQQLQQHQQPASFNLFAEAPKNAETVGGGGGGKDADLDDMAMASALITRVERR